MLTHSCSIGSAVVSGARNDVHKLMLLGHCFTLGSHPLTAPPPPPLRVTALTADACLATTSHVLLASPRGFGKCINEGKCSQSLYLLPNTPRGVGTDCPWVPQGGPHEVGRRGLPQSFHRIIPLHISASLPSAYFGRCRRRRETATPPLSSPAPSKTRHDHGLQAWEGRPGAESRHC